MLLDKIKMRVMSFIVLGGPLYAAFLPPVSFTEPTMAGANQFIFTGSALPVGGLVFVCEGTPTTIIGLDPLNACGGVGLPNHGISDVLGFIPSVNLGGGTQLNGQLASDADLPPDYADVNGIMFANPPGIPANVFVNPPIVALAESLGTSGAIEYAPQVGEPGYYDNGTGQTPLYYIFSDCTPISSCGSLNGPQMPPPIPPVPGKRFDFRVESGAFVTEVPEPATTGFTVIGLLAACLRCRKPSR
jgi:hypothetical protein